GSRTSRRQGPATTAARSTTSLSRSSTQKAASALELVRRSTKAARRLLEDVSAGIAYLTEPSPPS
ncbi:MAG: hypothetical protein ABJA86_14150, partial [Nocardioidaceae bacterium]